jgi:cytochrome b6-f complex iron-sulfur subunit
VSGSTIAVIATVALVALAALLLFGANRRRDAAAISRVSPETVRRDAGASPFLDDVVSGRDVERAAQQTYRGPGTAVEPAAERAPVPYVPVDPETIGVTRRQFFNRGMVTMMGVSLGGFGASTLAFLWPSSTGGFGSVVSAGNIDDILAEVEQANEPLYVPEGRFYLAPFPESALDKAESVYGAELPGMEAGVVALYQKCVHLGCRVPFCTTSQWFECGCHGSQYNRVGEQKGGPAPRGLDRFPVEVSSGGSVSVNTGPVIIGPAKGTNTTGQESEGPHCISLGGGH